MATTEQFTNTPLFGGAITVDLPSSFADASQIRQIPDHQEVYLDADGYSSIVVEILEYVDKETDEEALQEHFADVVRDTGDSTTVLEQGRAAMKDEGLKNKPLYTLTFQQTPPSSSTTPSSSSSSSETPPAPRRRKTPDVTHITLLLLRLKQHATDILITINIPHYPGEYEGARDGQGQTRLVRDAGVVKERVLRSFGVVEWGLFEG